MTRTFQRTIAISAVAASIAALPKQAAAQAGEDTRSPTDGSVTEVVVMARKRAENTLDVPLAITAVSGAEFQARGLANVVDIQRQTPGLFIQQSNASPSSGFFSIRGTVQSDIIMTQDSPVSLYADGVYIPRQFGLAQSLYDIDHIEVLKGPQGTLYGKNTTGGAINVFTRAPTNDANGYLQFTLGTRNTRELQGAVTAPLVKDKLSLRVAGLIGERGAIERNAIGAKIANNDTHSGRAHLKFTPTEDVAIDLSADRSRLRGGGPRQRVTGFVPFGGARNFASTGSPYSLAMLQLLASGVADPQAAFQGWLTNERNNGGSPVRTGYDTTGLSGTAAWTLAPVIVKSITAYRRTKFDNFVDVDATPFDIFTSDRFENRSRFYSQELQISDDGSNNRFNWIVGGYYSRETGTEFTHSRILPALIPLVNIIDGQVTNSSWSAFAQSTISLTDSLRLTSGVRWTEERRKLISRNHDETFTGVPVNCSATGVFPGPCEGRFNDKFSDYSYLASLDYKREDQFLVYAKTSRGFRSGGQNLRGTVSGAFSTFPAFKPEVLTDYEIGLKTQFSDRFQFEVAGYYNRITGLQQSIFVPTPTGQAASLVRNVGRAHVWGGEASVMARPIPGLTLSGAAGLVNAKYDRFDDPLFGDRSDEDYPVPEFTYSLSAAYTVPVDFGSVTLRGDWTSQSKVNFYPSAFVSSDVTQKSYGLLNAALSAEIDQLGLDVAVFGTNVLNKRYFSGAIGLDSKGIPFGYSYGFLGLPRIVGLRLTKHFD